MMNLELFITFYSFTNTTGGGISTTISAVVGRKNKPRKFKDLVSLLNNNAATTADDNGGDAMSGRLQGNETAILCIHPLHWLRARLSWAPWNFRRLPAGRKQIVTFGGRKMTAVSKRRGRRNLLFESAAGCCGYFSAGFGIKYVLLRGVACRTYDVTSFSSNDRIFR